jgi:hypothetical protein
LKSRSANRVQLTTDGHKAYLTAVEDGKEQGIQLGGGPGLQALHFVRKEVFGEGSLIVRPATMNTPSPW